MQKAKGEGGTLFSDWTQRMAKKKKVFLCNKNNNPILNWKKYLNIKTSRIDDTYNNVQEYKPVSDELLKKRHNHTPPPLVYNLYRIE